MNAAMPSPFLPPAQPDDAESWRAVAERDARYDGRFVYAVTSTRIFCRPGCPSRRPSRANVLFFATPGDAARAGFRACKRCAPERGGQTAAGDAIARAREYLELHAARSVSLAELGAAVGMSAHHLQRTFTRTVGVSPKAYQDAARARLFKQRLRAGDTVSRATYEAGYGSSSRVYEGAAELLGMTPASYRRGGAGIVITYAISDAPVGRVLVGTTLRGVCAVALGDGDDDVIAALRADFPAAILERDDERHAIWVRAVIDRVRVSGSADEHRVPLDVDGTAFQLRVWNALRSIPPGERRSYAEVAAAIGQPSATRAVARACATNRVAVIIPCHRVVRGDGALSGYKWGVERKRRLLDDERR